MSDPIKTINGEKHLSKAQVFWDEESQELTFLYQFSTFYNGKWRNGMWHELCYDGKTSRLVVPDYKATSLEIFEIVNVLWETFTTA